MKDWTGTGEAYAASYASLCAGTAPAIGSALGPAAGRTLLDVGSGTGELAVTLSGAGWSVTGCEPEPSMRAVAQRDRPELPVVSGALPKLPFEDASFDVVIANFVLNHVPDPRASARELARVSARAVVATTWTRSPSWLWQEVCERAGLTPSAGERLPVDKDFERSAGGFEGMLRDAGWERLDVFEFSWTWEPDPGTLWVSAEGGVGAAGHMYRGLGASGRTRFREAFDAVCAERAVGERVPLTHTAAVAVGRRG